MALGDLGAAEVLEVSEVLAALVAAVVLEVLEANIFFSITKHIVHVYFSIQFCLSPSGTFLTLLIYSVSLLISTPPFPLLTLSVLCI